jgi:hypothetical protein
MNLVSKSIRNEFTDSDRENAAVKYNAKEWKKLWVELFELIEAYPLQITAGNMQLSAFGEPGTSTVVQFRIADDLAFYKSLVRKAVKGRGKHVIVSLKWPGNDMPKEFNLSFNDMAEAMMTWQYSLPGSGEFKVRGGDRPTIKAILQRLDRYLVNEVTIGSVPY